MQNDQIWKSIEALCDEAESVIGDGTSAMTVIESIAPPAFGHQQKSSPTVLSVLSSKAAPPIANIIDKPSSRKNVIDAPLSPATMTEIAAAIDRASQSPQKLQIMDQPSQVMSDLLRENLMTEVSQAVRSVLANELPQIVRHAISESLHELITTSAKPTSNDLGVLETKSAPKRKRREASGKKKATKKDKGKKQPN